MFKFWFHRVLAAGLISAPIFTYLIVSGFEDAAGAVGVGFAFYTAAEVMQRV